MNSFMMLRENLGMKSFDLGSKLFLEYIYSDDLESNTKRDTSDWGKVIRSFVNTYKDKS